MLCKLTNSIRPGLPNSHGTSCVAGRAHFFWEVPQMDEFRTCRVCGRDLSNDTYGSRCEDCWAVEQRRDGVDRHREREALAYLHAALAAA